MAADGRTMLMKAAGSDGRRGIPTADVPLELLRYRVQIRSVTRGAGSTGPRGSPDAQDPRADTMPGRALENT